MIDYIKGCLTDRSSISRILSNEKFEFVVKLCEGTGEISSFPKTARYGEWKIIVHSPTLALIQGSLHKYFTKGRNHNDFTFSDLFKSITSFCNQFEISPHDIKIQNIEFGVNVCPDIPATEILRHALAYKNKREIKPFDSEKGYFIEFEFDDYYFKLYDKGKQYNTSANILRIELKATRSRFVSKCNVHYLVDLLKPSTLAKLGSLLVQHARQIVWDDPVIDEDSLNLPDRKIYSRLKNPKAWESVRNNKSSRDRYQEKRFKDIVSKYGNYQLATTINNLVSDKWQQLLSDCEYAQLEQELFLDSLENKLQIFTSNVYSEKQQIDRIAI